MIIKLKETEVSSIHGGKCMFCKWLNDHIGKPVFEDGGREVVKAVVKIAETVVPVIIADKVLSAQENGKNKQAK